MVAVGAKRCGFPPLRLENNIAFARRISGKVRTIYCGISPTIIQDIAPSGRVLVSSDEGKVSMALVDHGSSEERDLDWLDSSYWPRLSRDGSEVTFTDQSEIAGSNYSVIMYERLTGRPRSASAKAASFLTSLRTENGRSSCYPAIQRAGCRSFPWELVKPECFVGMALNPCGPCGFRMDSIFCWQRMATDTGIYTSPTRRARPRNI